MQPPEVAADNRPIVREVPLGPSVDVQHLKDVFRGLRSDDDALTVIDFKKSKTFDVVALLCVLAMIGTRIAADRLTRFRLPRKRAALDMLRRGRFFEAAGQVAGGAPLPMLLHLEDVQRLEDSDPDPDFAGWASGDPSEQIVQYLRSKRVFGLSLYGLESTEARTTMMRQELARWTDPLALALFSRHLKGAAEWDIARVVVHEVLANVHEHPNASTAVVASDMALPSKDGAPPMFTIAVWDNGDSIIETLRGALVSRGDIRVDPPPAIDTFRIHREGSDAPADEIRTSDWKPEVTSDDGDLLMASLLPGISSKAGGDVDRTGDQPSGRLVGYGLYFLYHHVIDVFEGALDVYVGALRLTVEAERDPDSTAKYVVTLREGLGTSKIRGNLVAVRLPTHA